jgi:hypothetical protein
MDNGTTRNSVVGAMLMRDVLLFNKVILKFHLPDVMLKLQIRNRGIPLWNNYLYYQQSMIRKYKRK